MEGAGMLRLLACFIVFSLASPAFAGRRIAEDQNWGDHQTAGGKQSDKLQSKPKPKFELKEKSPPLDLQKQKIQQMKD
jgi:hypothetical protein